MKLTNIGWVRLKEADYLPVGAHVNAATVCQVADCWFVSVLVEEKIADPTPTTDQVIGVGLFEGNFETCGWDERGKAYWWAAKAELQRAEGTRVSRKKPSGLGNGTWSA